MVGSLKIPSDGSNNLIFLDQVKRHCVWSIKLKDDGIDDGDDYDDNDGDDDDDNDGDVYNDDDGDLDLLGIQKDLHHTESSRPRILGLSIRRCFSN